MDELPVVRSQLPPPAGDVWPTRPPSPTRRLVPPLPPPRAPFVESGPSSVGPSGDDTRDDWTQDDETSIDWTGGATTLEWEIDDTSEQLPQSISAGNGIRVRRLSEDTFQSVRRHLSTLALAVALAIPVAVVAFIGLASVRSAFDDRQFWASEGHSLVQFSYILVLFVAAMTPVTFSVLRSGVRAARALVVDRGYWKVLLVAFVGIPLLGAVVMFVAGHLVAVLVVLVAVLLIVVFTGGF